MVAAWPAVALVGSYELLMVVIRSSQVPPKGQPETVAPIEVSSGRHKVCRLSRRGNRRVNHAIHMAAVTQVSHRHSEGRAYYDKKIAGGKTPKEALRSLKRRVSDAVFACLQADARRAAGREEDPGGQTGNDSVPGAAGSHPARRLFGKATPGPPAHPTAAAAGTEPAGTPGLSPAAAKSPPAAQPGPGP